MSDWTDESDIGIVLRNLDASFVEVRQVEGFTIGLRTLGDERGFEDTTLMLGRIVNNKIGLDIRTATAAAWNTSVRYYGGHFAIASSLHPERSRYGVRFSAAPGAYISHNRHVFHGPGFELQARDRPAIVGIPFLCEVSSRAVIASAVRMEGCSPAVALHTGGAQDHVYEVAWASQGYNIGIEYAPTATRVGSVVRALHQAAGHREAAREVASVPNLRAAAFRFSNTRDRLRPPRLPFQQRVRDALAPRRLRPARPQRLPAHRPRRAARPRPRPRLPRGRAHLQGVRAGGGRRRRRASWCSASTSA